MVLFRPIEEDVKPSFLNPVFLGCLGLSDYVHFSFGEDFLTGLTYTQPRWQPVPFPLQPVLSLSRAQKCLWLKQESEVSTESAECSKSGGEGKALWLLTVLTSTGSDGCREKLGRDPEVALC